MSAAGWQGQRRPQTALALRDPPWVRALLIVLAVSVLLSFLVLPLAVVLMEALRPGLDAYAAALADDNTHHALLITLVAALLTVPLNLIFGIAAAWLVTRFRFPGKSLLITLIDLPFSVSPVVVGLSLVLLYGAHGWFGAWLVANGVKVVFALPGIVLATIFVTVPFVARELIPLMQAQGREEEEAALVLGANGWQVLRHVTLPNIRIGLLYGVILCNARAMGEFGAVSVVSGHIRGQTVTLPLHVEMLYQEYQTAAAFAVASMLALLALATLLAQHALEALRRPHPPEETSP
ncbi:MAG TPA: sulfate ABC transporter permease subunit CysW [Gammaproteobacteria bacterium]|nr:sulfate ABC transporter permease subunit CysW [Gammaproteobacteria bacterium]